MKVALQELDTFVTKKIIPLTRSHHIFLLVGTLGAGKTTLVKHILTQLGVNQAITSPTFGYVKSYHTQALTIHHFDLYRISSVYEFIDAGFDEYLTQPNSISFIEWPDVIIPLLQQQPVEKIIRLELSQVPTESTIREINTTPF